MPSFSHEALVMLFRHRATLAPELLERALDVELPAYTEARVEDANLSQIVPTSYHADLVVLLTEDQPVYGIVVEVQLGRDAEKQFSWPLYAAALRARLRTPTAILVVAPDPAIAEWASRPIRVGPNDATFVPLVLGPGMIPWITRTEDAKAAPELAVLSAMAHGKEATGLEIATAALVAASGLDESRAALYADLIMASLDRAIAKELLAMVQSGKYEYQSDFAKEYFARGKLEGQQEGETRGRAQGRAEGQARALLHILASRGLTPADDQRSRVLACSDVQVLDRWIDRALVAARVEDVFASEV